MAFFARFMDRTTTFGTTRQTEPAQLGTSSGQFAIGNGPDDTTGLVESNSFAGAPEPFDAETVSNRTRRPSSGTYGNSFGSKKNAQATDVEAFHIYDNVSDLAEAVRSEAARLGRCAYVPKIIDDEGNTSVDDSEEARESLRCFRPFGGTLSDNAEAFGSHMLLTGKTWLLGRTSPQRDLWDWRFVSSTNLRFPERGDGAELFEEGEWRPLSPTNSYYVPHIKPHPQDPSRPDAPGLHLVRIGKQILLLDAVIDGLASIAMNGGVLKIPGELLYGPSNVRSRMSMQEKAGIVDKFKARFAEELTSAAEKPGSCLLYTSPSPRD